MKAFFVYIITNRRNGALYVGVTSNLVGRIYQHRTGSGSKYASQYNLTRLVFFEEISRADDAIAREKQIKRWSRVKKVELIERMNPSWDNLGERLFDE